MIDEISPQDDDVRALEPLDDAIDHIRGPGSGRVILEYGDYECPYSRQAYREIQRAERHLEGQVRFVFRHFPLTEIHPHALAAAAAAEAADVQERFWVMHDSLFHHQDGLEDRDLRHYAAAIGLNLQQFDDDRNHPDVLRRVGRDVQSGLASGRVTATPTLFIDGIVHEGPYDADTLIAVLTNSSGAS
jgi:protein-disulfide isomerase